MATKIKTFDWTKPSTLTTTDKATYPWDQWFDGDIWEITWDENESGDGDFQTHPLMMERIIRTRATGRGAKVRSRHVGMNGDPWGKIVVQRTDIIGPNEAKAAERKAKSAATRAAKAEANGAPANGKKVVAKKAPRTVTKRVAVAV